MTAKEIVRRAIRLERPPRLPVIMDCYGVSDIGIVPVGTPTDFRPVCEDADEWGCVWSRTEVKNMPRLQNPWVAARQISLKNI